mmetsp:Transcript_9971/g.30416  ORF Transcript_9971/g.30416 Transcript_9971/m.30416 type:complete len:86 (-) Transcript_9971:298-555(-)
MLDEHVTAYKRDPSRFREENPGVYLLHAKKLKMALVPAMRPDVNVVWVYGPTGVGKSRLAHTAAPKAYSKMSMSTLWNRCDQHRS